MPQEPTALIIVDVQNDFLPPTGSLAVAEGRDTLPRIYKFLEDEEWAAEWDLVVATQDWHPRGHVSFASSHEGGKPYTKIKIPKRHTGETAASEQGPEGDEMIDMFIWPDHCIPGTTGADIEEGLQERLKPWLAKGKLAIARKGYNMDFDAFSAFQGSIVTNAKDPLARTDEVNVIGPDVGSYLVGKGIKRCVVVGLATDYCVAQTTLSALSHTTGGKKAFQTFVYTPAVRGVNEDDSKKALANMKEKGATLIDDEHSLKAALK
ncbi:hypothetical protein QFC19_004250, partial [Naganishia cerealis]